MRSLSQVEREIAEVEAMAASPGPSFDNDGNLMTTAEDRAASYNRRLERLQQERQALLKILGRDRGVVEVTVSPADLDAVVFDGSVVVVTGTTGNTRVTFVGDTRPTRALLTAVAETGEPMTAFVADHQVVRQQPIARPLSRTPHAHPGTQQA